MLSMSIRKPLNHDTISSWKCILACVTHRPTQKLHTQHVYRKTSEPWHRFTSWKCPIKINKVAFMAENWTSYRTELTLQQVEWHWKCSAFWLHWLWWACHSAVPQLSSNSNSKVNCQTSVYVCTETPGVLMYFLALLVYTLHWLPTQLTSSVSAKLSLTLWLHGQLLLRVSSTPGKMPPSTFSKGSCWRTQVLKLKSVIVTVSALMVVALAALLLETVRDKLEIINYKMEDKTSRLLDELAMLRNTTMDGKYCRIY